MLRLSQFNRKQPSLFFDQWAENSVINDEDNLPKTLYHGTTHAFDSFDVSKSNPENYFGPGLYFSDSPYDSSANYTGEGRDLQDNVDRLAEQIYDDISYGYKDDEELYEKYKDKHPEWFEIEEDNLETNNLNTNVNDQNLQVNNEKYIRINEDFLYDVARAEALEQLHGQKPNIIPVFVKMKNPIKITEENPTVFSYEPEYDEKGLVEDQGNFLKLLDVINDNIAGSFSTNSPIYNELIADLWDNSDYLTAFKLNSILKSHLGEAIYESGTNLVADIFKDLGFDGIIMDAKKFFPNMKGIAPETKHYIVWDNKKVKSAIGNTGIYDVSSSNIVAKSQKKIILAKKINSISQYLDGLDYYRDSDLLDKIFNSIVCR